MIWKALKLLGTIVAAIFAILAAWYEYKDYAYIKYIFAALNIIIVLVVSDALEIIIDMIKEKAREREYGRNKHLCASAAGKYNKYIEGIKYSQLEDNTAIAIVEQALKIYCEEKSIDNLDAINGVRIAAYYQIWEKIGDIKTRDSVHGQLQNIIAQYNFAGESQKVLDALKALAKEKEYPESQYRERALSFMKEMIPNIEVCQMQKKLNQLTRFKEFIKDKFSARFPSSKVLKNIIEKGKENCYWIVARRIDDSVKKYLLSYPFLATKPAKSHNFPGLRSVTFSHYLIRIEDPLVKSADDLKNRIEILRPSDSQMLLFIFPVYSKNIQNLLPRIKEQMSEAYYTNIALKTMQYHLTGILEIPPDTSDFGKIINAGKISIEEIIRVLPLSFLIKRTREVKLDYYDEVGEYLKDIFGVEKITDWGKVEKGQLYEEMKKLVKPIKLKNYLRRISDRKLKNICSSIIENANELNGLFGV